MIRLTRHEAAYALAVSYRTLNERLKRMGLPRYFDGPLSEDLLGRLEINQKVVDAAYRRAASITVADQEKIRSSCSQCRKLGRWCNEHKGFAFFLPKQTALQL